MDDKNRTLYGDWEGRDPVKPVTQRAVPPLAYFPDTDDVWSYEMFQMFQKHNAIVFIDDHKNYHIHGDGIKLFLPFDWIVMTPDDDLVAYILQGINVSLAHRERLGY